MAENAYGLHLDRLRVFTAYYKTMKEAQKARDELNAKLMSGKVRVHQKSAVYEEFVLADTVYKEADTVLSEVARGVKEFHVIPVETSEDLEIMFSLKKEYAFGGEIRGRRKEAERGGFVVHRY